MHIDLLQILACPKCQEGSPLEIVNRDDVNGHEIISGALVCRSCNSEFLIRNGIPRFVSFDEDYCENFSFQWHKWRTLQNDRLSGHTLSSDHFFQDGINQLFWKLE